MKFTKIAKWIVLCVALVFLAGAIIIYPERYIQSCFQGFAMWAECVLPSLFPFMVIMLIFIKTGIAERAALPLKKATSIFGLPPAAAVCFVMSICSGYPAGSRAVAEFYESGSVNAKDCKKLAALCSTSGPLFIIGSIGVKMLNDKGAGWKILLAHVVAVLLVSVIICLFTKKGEKAEYRRAPADKNVLYNAFYSGVISVAVAGGFIAFFCVAAQVAVDFNLLYPIEKLLCLFTDETSAQAVCRGLVEATSGCRSLADGGGKLTLPFAGFLITFGGISILMQQLSYLLKAKVNALYFIGVKFIQGVISLFILLPFCL
ncbi:MAG: hypothetical protein K2K60_04620 [Clostridia bacterium]|nr:hypothetical protein [Clostridia bacterium]